MAHEDPVPPIEVEPELPEDRYARLDPETRARRDAALRLVRKYGDPVLKSRALPVERFDDGLREEIRRMGDLMNDAWDRPGRHAARGHAPRARLPRRPDAPVAAVVNPVLEWSSRDEEALEEGCLSLPNVLVDVDRPVHVRIRAQDETGEEILIEASGLEARVLQHEMDHLDGVLILDRTSRDQRKQAMRTLREGAESDPLRVA